MTNQIQETTETKKRRAPLKNQKTGQEIFEEIKALENAVEQFEVALSEVDPSSVAYPIVKAEADKAGAALVAALEKIHHS